MVFYYHYITFCAEVDIIIIEQFLVCDVENRRFLISIRNVEVAVY